MNEPEPLDAVQALVEDNDRRLQALAELNIGVGGLEHVTTVTFLEHFLRAVAGEDAVRACKLDLATRISNILDPAEKQAEIIREKMAEADRIRRLGLHPMQTGPMNPAHMPTDPFGPSPTGR